MEPLTLLIGLLVAGTLSLGVYLKFRYGADRVSDRRFAGLAIQVGAPNWPMVLAAGAAFWYSGALAVVTRYLDQPWREPTGLLALVLNLISMVLMVYWSYRPPRWLIPDWYQVELDARPKQSDGRRSAIIKVTLFWLWGLLILGAYMVYRFDGPPTVWVPLAVAGVGCLIGYVLHD